jgi:NADPH:quinone reductase-like Zn-dependent oxidoreductase
VPEKRKKDNGAKRVITGSNLIWRIKMKAIVYQTYGAPDVLQLKEVEKPAPRENEVLIKINETIVTPADCSFRKGKPFITRFFAGLIKPKHIPGVELAGEIEAVGNNVKTFSIGDRVFGSAGTGFGAHAQYKCLPEDGTLAEMPDGFTFGEAAAVCDGALAALTFLREKANIQNGHRVLINGASGSVGSFAVQLAVYFGADVTGVCSTTNIELVKSLGAHTVIDYTREDFTQTGQTYDIIFDAVARSSFSRCKPALKPKGIYLTTVPTPRVLFQMLITSISGGKKALFIATNHNKENLLYLKKLMEAGKIKTIIDKYYPLEQIAEAHRYVESGHKKGTVVITVNHN